jgi:hypothetical protein
LWIADVEREVDSACDGKYTWRRFMVAVDTVEHKALGALDDDGRAVEKERLQRAGAKQSHAQADRALLACLRNEETKHLITEALKSVDDCRKGVDEETRLHGDQRLILSLLNARLASEDPEKLAQIHERDVARHRELKNCADKLEKYFADEIHRDPESLIVLGTAHDQLPVDFESLTVSLQRMQHILTRRLDELLRLEFRFTRRTVSAQKTIFMATVCYAMEDIFGQPLYKAVALLTDVALATKEQTDDHQARTANRNTKDRQAAPPQIEPG